MVFKSHMNQALEEARAAAERGEVPVGAVLVGPSGDVIATAGNRTRELSDPTAHAEIVAIRAAADADKNYRLTGATLYVTLEPCAMCVGAMLHARISRLVFGAYDPKSGAAGSVIDLCSDRSLNHRIEVNGGLLESQCSGLLKQFFEERRQA